MTEPAELAALTPLIRRLCDAGELDAALSLIEFLKAKGGSSKSLLPLRAQAFLCEESPVERKREVLRGVRASSLDAIGRAGAIGSCAAIYKLMAELFADDRVWRRKLRRVELLLSPLPDADTDPEQRSVTELLMADKAQEALAVLRQVAHKRPDDPRLRQRCEELQVLLLGHTSTRPYKILSPEEAKELPALPKAPPEAPPEAPPKAPPEAHSALDPVLVREAVLAALLKGDLSGAEPAARALAATTQGEGAAQLPEAIGRLAAIQRSESVSTANDEVTMRLSPTATVDLWVRQGMLSRALEQARELLSRPENKDCVSALSERLNDLERVLAMIPSPDASRPPDDGATTEFVVLREVAAAPAPVVTPVATPVATPVVTPDVAAGDAPVEPTAAAPASTKVARRKVVRLG